MKFKSTYVYISLFYLYIFNLYISCYIYIFLFYLSIFNLCICCYIHNCPTCGLLSHSRIEYKVETLITIFSMSERGPTSSELKSNIFFISISRLACVYLRDNFKESRVQIISQRVNWIISSNQKYIAGNGFGILLFEICMALKRAFFF